jgi:hypothetical protein
MNDVTNTETINQAITSINAFKDSFKGIEFKATEIKIKKLEKLSDHYAKEDDLIDENIKTTVSNARNHPFSIKSFIDSDNAIMLDSKKLSNLDKIDKISEFYQVKGKSVSDITEEEMTMMLEYSDRISKSNIVSRSTHEDMQEMVNEIIKIISNLGIFSSTQIEGNKNIIKINYDKLFDTSPNEKALLAELEELTIKENDSRSSSYTSPAQKSISSRIKDVRAEITKDNLKSFEIIMLVNKYIIESKITNHEGIHLLKSMIARYSSVFEMEQSIKEKPIAAPMKHR